MDPAYHRSLSLPCLTFAKTKNILIVIDGKAEYRDIPVEEIFLNLSTQFFKQMAKRSRSSVNPRLDEKISHLFEKMRRFVEEYPEFAYQLPAKPNWIE